MKFDFGTIKNFDRHILSSVPRYDEIHNIIYGMAKYFIRDKTNVYDIGCSTGLLLKSLSRIYSAKDCHYIGYDISANLLPDSRANLHFYRRDVADINIAFENASLAFSIFTLQFLEPDKRQEVVNKIYGGLKKSGAFIITEKIYAAHPKIQDIFTFLYYDYKKKYFTSDEIYKKEEDLRDMMFNLTEDENVEMLKEAGFRIIEVFYKYYNFVGWLCIK